jgi:hypothetical protein
VPPTVSAARSPCSAHLTWWVIADGWDWENARRSGEPWCLSGSRHALLASAHLVANTGSSNHLLMITKSNSSHPRASNGTARPAPRRSHSLQRHLAPTSAAGRSAGRSVPHPCQSLAAVPPRLDLVRWADQFGAERRWASSGRAVGSYRCCLGPGILALSSCRWPWAVVARSGFFAASFSAGSRPGHELWPGPRLCEDVSAVMAGDKAGKAVPTDLGRLRGVIRQAN